MSQKVESVLCSISALLYPVECQASYTSLISSYAHTASSVLKQLFLEVQFGVSPSTYGTVMPVALWESNSNDNMYGAPYLRFSCFGILSNVMGELIVSFHKVAGLV